MKEIWKPVVDPRYSEDYQVSNMGRVRSLKRGKMLILKQYTPKSDTGNYKRCTISLNSPQGATVARVATLVLEAFVGIRPTFKKVPRHRNGNYRDNQLSNLYWDKWISRSNSRRKLTIEAIRMIRLSPLPAKTLAYKLGVSKTTIRSVLSGRTWKHVL